MSECPVDNLTKIQPLHITNQSIATSSTKPTTYNAFLPLLNFFLSCQSAPLPPVSSMKHFGHELIQKAHENNSGTAYYVVLTLIWYNGFWNALRMLESSMLSLIKIQLSLGSKIDKQKVEHDSLSSKQYSPLSVSWFWS